MTSIKCFLALIICFLSFTSLINIKASDINTIETQICYVEECQHEHEELENEHVHLAYTYTNVCWRCHSSINSNVNKRCSLCGWYICTKCKACDPQCSRCPSWNGSSNNSSSKKTDNSWIWILVIGGAVVGGIILYKKYKSK